MVRFFSFSESNAKSKPVEDAHYHVGFNGADAFAVADGVSRSCYGIKGIPSSLPAAEAFCRISASALANGASFQDAFSRANNEIALINERAGITSDITDYLDWDYMCCVGIGGVICERSPNTFSYGYIGDCGILVYDINSLPVFLSDSLIPDLEQFRKQWGCKDNVERTLLWRRHLRNNPGARGMTFGSLTGEEAALSYIKDGELTLAPGDTIILFSDGIHPFIFDRRFRMMVSDLLSDDAAADAIKHEMISDYIASLIETLQKKGVGNLDDDKTFIAIAIG